MLCSCWGVYCADGALRHRRCARSEAGGGGGLADAGGTYPCFAAAGLGGHEHIAAIEDQWASFGLDVGREPVDRHNRAASDTIAQPGTSTISGAFAVAGRGGTA